MNAESNDNWGGPPLPLGNSNSADSADGGNTSTSNKPQKKKSRFFGSFTKDIDEAERGEAKTKEEKKSKTKSFTRKVSMVYMKQLEAVQASRFADWTKAELAELLVDCGYEIRNEAILDVVTLRDVADQIFAGADIPPKPPMPSLFDVVLRNVMARRLQDAWVAYQFNKREENEMSKSHYYNNAMKRIETMDDLNAIGRAELMYMTMPHDDLVGGQDIEVGNVLSGDSADGGDGVITQQPDGGIDIGREGSATTLNTLRKQHNVLDVPWQPPDVKKATRYADYVQPRKGGKGGKLFNFYKTTTGRHCCLGSFGEQFDLWEEGQISEFGIYGPGVTNYFKFLKFCFWLFVILTIVALPIISLNVSVGDRETVGLKRLSSTTIGNLADQLNSTWQVHIPGCDSFALLQTGSDPCYLTGPGLALVYSILDIVICVIVFAGFIWLSLFEQYEEIELNQSTIKASMYTIRVSNLPPDVTEVDLLNHFGKLVGRKDAITNISMAYNNEEEIHVCRQRGDIIRQKIRLVHEHRRKCTELNQSIGKGKTEEQVNTQIVSLREKFFETMGNLNKELQKKEKQLEELSKQELKVVCAFITFNKMVDRDEAYKAYNEMTLYTWCFHTDALKLKGKMPKVKDAPEPSMIVWENLRYPYSDRFWRRFMTTCASLFLIVLSLAMIFSSKYLEERTQNNGYKTATVCPSEWNSWDTEVQDKYVTDNPEYLHCYCDPLTTFQQANDPLCRSYLRKTINSQVLMYFASFIVLLVNYLMTVIMKYYALYEKHHSGEGEGMSIFFRMLILKYINTAGVFLINNNNFILRSVFGLVVSSAPSFTADWYSTVGVTIILVQLGDIVNCHIDIFLKYWSYRRMKANAEKDPTIALTQEDLNKMFVGPEFEFAFNYAQLLSTLFVTLTFSTGIPLLYPIAAMNFITYYFVEKYMFIHLYKIPPHFNTVLGRRATGVIPVALLIHISVAIWMLSNKSIFTNAISDDSQTDDYNQSATHVSQVDYHAEERVTQRATFPLFILFFIIIFLWVSIYFSQILNIGFSRVYTFYFGCCKKKEELPPDHLDALRGAHKRGDTKRQLLKSTQAITYVRAVQRNLIKGLATYNILQNPAYKEDFGITWKFAIKHKDVRSVRRLKLRAQRSDFEDDAAQVESLQRTALSVGITERLSAGASSSHSQPNSRSTPRKRPSFQETNGSATSETSRISVKSVTKNRSFYGSFYEQQPDDKIVLQIDTQKEFNKMVGKGKQANPSPTKGKKDGRNRTPTKPTTQQPSQSHSGETKKLPSQHPRKANTQQFTAPPPNTTTPPSGKNKNKHAMQYSSPPQEDKPVPLRANYHPMANRPMPPPPPIAMPISDAKPMSMATNSGSQRSVHSNSPTPRRYGNPNDVVDVEAFEVEMRPGGLNQHRFSPYPASPPQHQYANALRSSFPNQQAPPPNGNNNNNNTNSGRRNGPPFPPARPNNYY